MSNWRRVEEIVHAALERSPDDRAAFVRDACAGYDVLRVEVESLLANQSRADALGSGLGIRDSGLGMSTEELIGKQIGVYRVVSLLGTGGMGEVYRARDTKLQRDVAIKVLPAGIASDPERLARFQREARVLASLNHPHIGAIHGFEESAGIAALVLELVEGPTLAERIKKGPLSMGDALKIARQIAEALDAAHEKGIIHRDLKPANIKLTADGQVKVLDFGLAKFAHSSNQSSAPATETLATRAGAIFGTPAYMSPEQARGLSVDRRTDIWAFGCVLYEMLTGRAAFARDTLTDTLAAVVEGRPNWSLVSAPARPVTRLIQRCLETDVRRRLRDIADARIELDDAPSGAPAPEPESALESGRKPLRWPLVAAGAIAGVGISAVVAAIAFTRLATVSSSGGAPARIVASQLTNYDGTESGGSLSPDGRSFVFVSNHDGTPDIYLRQVSGGEPVRLTSDAAEEARPAFAPDGDTIYYTRIDEAGTGIWRTGALGGQPRKVLDNAQTPAPSPDGKRLAYVTRGKDGFTIGVMALDGSGARTLVERIRTGVGRPAWSPDSRSITYSDWALFGPTTVFVVDASTGQQRQVAQLWTANDGGQPAWLPDNRHLAISYLPLARQQAPADLGVLDTLDGSIVRLTTTVGDGLYAPSVSADGSRLIATRLHYFQEIWKVPLGSDPDTNGRTAVRLIGEFAGPLWTFVSRDGRTVLFNSPASGSRNLWTAPPDPGAHLSQITTVPGDAISHSSLSPDGTRVAFASIAAGHSDIWTQRVDGSDLRQLTNDEPADSWPVWSPDDEWIVYQSYRADRQETWRIRASGGLPEKLLDQGFRGDWIRQPGGNGTWIVTTGSSTGSGVRLIDVERRVVVWDQAIPGGGLSLPVFRPDGRAISAPFREDRVHDVIRIFDATTGTSRIVARLPFHVTFRAGWTDEGRAVVVNRNDEVSHIVMFDHFWLNDRGQ